MKHTDARVKLSTEIVTGEASSRAGQGAGKQGDFRCMYSDGAGCREWSGQEIWQNDVAKHKHHSLTSPVCPPPSSSGIKAIKLYAWEDAYVERISALRELELKQIRRTQLLTALNTAVFMVRGVDLDPAYAAAHRTQHCCLHGERGRSRSGARSCSPHSTLLSSW